MVRFTREQPGLVIFLLDQSGSMEKLFGKTGRSKSMAATEAINQTIALLIRKSTREESWPRDYFDISVIGYGAEEGVASPQFAEEGHSWTKISSLAKHPIDSIVIPKGPDPLDPKVYHEVEAKMPIWFKPRANADTPMCAAFREAQAILEDWIPLGQHKKSLPPVVINITDGEATDGDPEPLAGALMNQSTDEGNVMIWNCHITSSEVEPIEYPSSEDMVVDNDLILLAKKMFRMSSELPTQMIDSIKLALPNKSIGEHARAYVFNGNMRTMVELLKIGTVVNVG